MLAELTMLLLAGFNSFRGPDYRVQALWQVADLSHTFFEIGIDHQRQSKQSLRTIARFTLKMLATFLGSCNRGMHNVRNDPWSYYSSLFLLRLL